MTSENWEKLQIEILVTQREAMIAENQMRISKGEYPVYGESDLWAIANQLHELGQKL